MKRLSWNGKKDKDAAHLAEPQEEVLGGELSDQCSTHIAHRVDAPGRVVCPSMVCKWTFLTHQALEWHVQIERDMCEEE